MIAVPLRNRRSRHELCPTRPFRSRPATVKANHPARSSTRRTSRPLSRWRRHLHQGQPRYRVRTLRDRDADRSRSHRSAPSTATSRWKSSSTFSTGVSSSSSKTFTTPSSRAQPFLSPKTTGTVSPTPIRARFSSGSSPRRTRRLLRETCNPPGVPPKHLTRDRDPPDRPQSTALDSGSLAPLTRCSVPSSPNLNSAVILSEPGFSQVESLLEACDMN